MLINGHELYVVQEGSPDAQVIFFLHQGLGSVQSWKGQISFFASHNFRVVAYDRWGYGHSASRLQFSMPDFEDDLLDLRAIYDSLSIRQAVLIGHSDGGTIALNYAARFPKSVLCVITVAAHIYAEAKMASGIESVRIAYETQPVFQQGLKRLHGEKTEAVFFDWYNGWSKPENLDWNIQALLKRIRCPVLVVQGEEDEHATPKHAEDIARGIERSELWLVPGARHMLPQDIPEIFNIKALSFIKGVRQRIGVDIAGVAAS